MRKVKNKSNFKRKKEVFKRHKIIYLLVIWVSFFIASTSVGQQLPQYTQFSINPYVLNPAIAGTEDFLYVQTSYKSQWQGFEGSPQTGYLTGHSTLNKRTIGYNQKKFNTERWFSLGGVFTYDKTGPIKQTSGYATLAYNMPLSSKGLRISFGINTGIKNFSYSPEGFLGNIPDQNDPSIQNGYNNTVLDMALGFWLYNKKFFAGISSFQLLENKLKNNIINEQNLLEGSLLRHYFLMAGLKINFNKDLYIVPSVLVKSISQLPLSFDVNSKLVYKNTYWVGINYRNEESFAGFIGMLVNKRLEISYSYDIITSSIRHSSSGSNEILLGYRFNKDPKILCPDEFW